LADRLKTDQNLSGCGSGQLTATAALDPADARTAHASCPCNLGLRRLWICAAGFDHAPAGAAMFPPFRFPPPSHCSAARLLDWAASDG